jgi:hypothetical protein
VSLPEWVGALRESAREMKDVAINPAIKLLDFYEGLSKNINGRIVLDLKKSCSLSPTLASMSAIDGKLIENWMQQWRF